MFRAAKNKRFWAPLILLAVASLLLSLVTYEYVDMGEMTVKMMEQRGQQLTPEQRDQILIRMRGPFLLGFNIFGSVVFPVVTVALIALLFMGLFTVIGREGNYRSFLAVTAFAWVPSIIRIGAAALTVMLVPQTQVSFDELGGIGPAIFFDRTGMSRKLFAAVGQIDVVTIWMLILLVIGYRFVVRKSVSSTTIGMCVFGLWLFYAACRVLIA